MSQVKGPAGNAPKTVQPGAVQTPASAKTPLSPATASNPRKAGGTDQFAQGGGPALRPVGSEDEQRSVARDPGHFDATMSALEVEGLGNLHGAVHLVKLMAHWTDAGMEHSKVVQDAAALLLSFARPDAARAVLKEMDRAPIKAAYPLELQLALVDRAPDFFPNVTRGPVVENKDALARGDRILAGHDTRVHFPSTMKIKAFALLSPGQPGYEFEPLRTGAYRLLVDSPGEWTFALRGDAPGKSMIDTFTVRVKTPGAVGSSAL